MKGKRKRKERKKEKGIKKRRRGERRKADGRFRGDRMRKVFWGVCVTDPDKETKCC